MGYRWTKTTATMASRKGLAVRRRKMGGDPKAYRKGYQAGWAACERFYRQTRGKAA
jgi:hypothetical protein